MKTRIIILILLALLGATYAVAEDPKKYTDWVVECKNPTSCEAKTLRQGETTDGYPTIKITGKDRSHRKLFLSDAKYVDGSKKISIRIDKTSLIDLKPKRDLKRLNRGEYQVASGDVKNKLLSRMASGRKLQIFYTNVRGQAREPEYSLMGMGSALKRLGSTSPVAKAVVSKEPEQASKAHEQKKQEQLEKESEQVSKKAEQVEKKPQKRVQQDNSRSRVIKKFRNWQIRCASDSSCAATTYKMRGSIDGYPVLMVVMDSSNRRQLHIVGAQNMNGSKNIWIRVDRNKEIKLLPGRDFVRLSKREYKISNPRLLANVMSAIQRGRTLRLSYRNTRGQWRQPYYSLLGSTAAMNELDSAPENTGIVEKTPEEKPRDTRKAVVETRLATHSPIKTFRPSTTQNADIAEVIQNNNRRGSTSWWQKFGRSGKRWSVSCSGRYRCVATARGTVKGGKKDISIRVSGGSRGSRKFMLADAGMLDTTKPMRIQIDGNLPLHVVPRKDFKKAGRGEVRFVNSRLTQTLLAKMQRGDEMWVTYTSRQGRSRVTKFSLNGVNAALKKL
jgi:invasion protein IalB